MKPERLTDFRKECMSLITTFMNVFDPSGNSTELWNNKFKSLDDKQFVKEMKAILEHPKRYITPQIQAFNKKAKPKFESFSKIAKLVDIELDEYVVLPYLNENTTVSKPAITLTKVPVGMLHIKRLQQLVRKKNKIAIDIGKRDARSGQVISDSKGAAITDSDMYSLAVFGAKPIMKELYGPRADSIDAKEALYDAIRKGDRLPRLSDLPNDLGKKVALNTLNNYILGASLVTDLLTTSYVLPVTKEKIAKGLSAKSFQSGQ